MGTWTSLYFPKVPSSPAGTKKVSCLGSYLPDYPSFSPLFWIPATNSLPPPQPQGFPWTSLFLQNGFSSHSPIRPTHPVRSQPSMRSLGLWSCKGLYYSQFIVRSLFPSFDRCLCLSQAGMTSEGHHLRAFYHHHILPCLETGRSWVISWRVWVF